MAAIYSVTVTNGRSGKYGIQAFMQGGWTTIGSLKTPKRAIKFADLYAEATGLGVRVVDPS